MKIRVTDAARIMGVSPQFVRVAMQQRAIDIGDAVKMSSMWTYCISPAKLAARQGMTVEELGKEIASWSL